MNTTQEVFDACRIEGNNVYLPQQLDRKLYEQVNKALVGIGGKWNRSAKAHVFPSDPSKLLGRVKEGEKINLKKDFQFFETPDDIADELVRLAFEVPYQIGRILEPSAGQGAIIDAIHRKDPDIKVWCFELMGTNSQILKDKYTEDQIGLYRESNFLNTKNFDGYSMIIANPPFTKNQDIDHIMHMYKCLEPGGKLVSIASNHWAESSNKKETEFQEWLYEKQGTVLDIPKGSFKSSGTLVGGSIIIINK